MFYSVVIAVCCRVMQCLSCVVRVIAGHIEMIAECCRVMQCAAAFCCVLLCVAVRCCVLQCVAVCQNVVCQNVGGCISVSQFCRWL